MARLHRRAKRGSLANRRPYLIEICHRIEPRRSEIWLERNVIWLVRRLSQKAADFGAIAIDLGNVPIDAIKEMRSEVVREFGCCRPNGGIHSSTSTVFQLVFCKPSSCG
jgi:hypothetical protein